MPSYKTKSNKSKEKQEKDSNLANLINLKPDYNLSDLKKGNYDKAVRSVLKRAGV